MNKPDTFTLLSTRTVEGVKHSIYWDEPAGLFRVEKHTPGEEPKRMILNNERLAYGLYNNPE